MPRRAALQATLLLLCCSAELVGQFAGQAAVPPAPVGPPPGAPKLDGRRLAPLTRDEEIAIARSAAPPAVAERATVYVLQDTGFVRAVEGTNGFSCLLERLAGATVFPVCYDAEASKTFLLGVFVREKLVRAGKRYLDAAAAAHEAYRAGTFPTPPRGAMAYRLSPYNGFYGRGGVWTPNDRRIMILVPFATNENLGFGNDRTAEVQSTLYMGTYYPGTAMAYVAIAVGPGRPAVTPPPFGNQDAMSAIVARITLIADSIAAAAATPGTPFHRGADRAPVTDEWWSRLDAWVAELWAIDPRQLRGRPEWLTHGVLSEGLEALRGTRGCTPSTGPRPAPLPVGGACYAAFVRSTTTLPLTAESLVVRSAAARRQLDDELRPFARLLLGTDDPAAARRRLRSDPLLMAGTRERLFAMTRDATSRARQRLAGGFADPPLDSFVVEPEIEASEATAPPARYARSPDGVQPAKLIANLYKPEDQLRMDAVLTAIHEGYPGHHLQASYARRAPRHPALRLFPAAAYIEGWAFYTERLAEELGIYADDWERAWFRVHLSDGALALMIDARLHTRALSPDQSRDTMMIVAGRPEWQALNYVNRHLATPGQTVSYLVGYQEIMRLREQAQRALGDRFDLPAFHSRVLEDGPLTMRMLEQKIDWWIESVRRG